MQRTMSRVAALGATSALMLASFAGIATRTATQTNAAPAVANPRTLRQRVRLAAVAGVEVHLAAAGLLETKLDRVAETLQHAHDGLPGSGEERVVIAGDEEGYAHGEADASPVEVERRRAPES